MKRIGISPWPYGHTEALVIRDDDISYFTPPHTIEQIYYQAWRQGLGVSLGVIPNLRAINSPIVPPSHRGRLSFHKLCDNEELASYLEQRTEQNCIDIAQHGYSHEMIKGAPEFCITNTDDILRRLRIGKRILEKCFPKRISVFIAPWNTVSKHASRIIRKEGLALCIKEERSYRRLRSVISAFPLIRVLTQRVLPQRSSLLEQRARNTLDPYMRSTYNSLVFDNKEKRMYIYYDPLRTRDVLSRIPETGALFCILNHYWDYYEDWQDEANKKMLNAFYSVLDFFNKRQVWKTTLSQAVSWMRKLDMIEIKVRKREIAFRPTTLLQGLTIRGENCTLVPSSKANAEVKDEKGGTLIIYKELEANKTEIISFT